MSDEKKVFLDSFKKSDKKWKRAIYFYTYPQTYETTVVVEFTKPVGFNPLTIPELSKMGNWRTSKDNSRYFLSGQDLEKSISIISKVINELGLGKFEIVDWRTLNNEGSISGF